MVRTRARLFAWKATAANLIYSANRIPEISDTIVEIDNAMKWGFNFEMGPFETWDALGVAESVEKMEADGFQVPDNVKTMLAAGHASFYKTENGQRFYYDFLDSAYKPVRKSENIITPGRPESRWQGDPIQPLGYACGSGRWGGLPGVPYKDELPEPGDHHRHP